MGVPLRLASDPKHVAPGDLEGSPGVVARRIVDAAEGAPLVLAWHRPEVAAEPVEDRLLRLRPRLRLLRLRVPLPDRAPATPDLRLHAVASPPGVRVACRAFPAVARVSYALAASMLDTLARDLGLGVADLDPDRHALICFTSGGTGGDDLLAAAMASAGPGLPLVGGRVHRDGIVLDRRAQPDGAAVLLVEGAAPLRTLLVHPFRLTAHRTVVTACDPTLGLVHTLDGRPAAARIVELMGVDAAVLEGPAEAVMARLPAHLGWRIGGQLVIRPVLGARGDAVRVGGAVERGAVLRLVRREPEPVTALLGRVRQAVDELPVPAWGLWAFACAAHLAGEPGARLEAGLQAMGGVVIPALAELHGPVHTGHAVAGIVWGSRGG